MTGQPDNIVGSIGCLCILIIIAYGFLQGLKSKKKISRDWDMIPVGVVYNTPPKAEKVVMSSLQNDCISALVSLGNKKSDAKAATIRIFQTHNPQTVEEFIFLAYEKK
jgi:hypothetical protein